MRLRPEEKRIIIQAVKRVDPDADIYLFGSRADSTKKGGDIDILVHSQNISFDSKLEIKKYIFKHLDEQKIDIIVTGNFDDPFVKTARKNGILLT
ncbi:nucleotidyltransferase domain-containing protein [Desulfobacter latus]|uniref:Nucleotidyltransferase domain-containing protein n=1 Tax=Desulfobacter latus TaxID=2292 RepID=A0A850T7J4_9BACT|nr:nucleotidyltransferase domain-containing protein [Desulfobacter latus]NWH04368.1 nucleotidyltransferase domain-containing protein [Desulfobacter latus]